jgi:hypothetical protein
MSPVTRYYVIVGAVIGGCLLVTGTMDLQDAEIAAAQRREEAAAARARLSHPLPYTATVTQYGDGIREPRTRYYVPRRAREEGTP